MVGMFFFILGIGFIFTGLFIWKIKKIELFIENIDKISDRIGYCRWLGKNFIMMGSFTLLNMIFAIKIPEYFDLSLLGYVTIIIIIGINMAVGCKKYRKN